MPTTVKDMVAAANAVVPRITCEQAREMIANGGALMVDVRDTPELAAGGKVAGAVHVSRGMLELRADPDSPFHHAAFAIDRTVILILWIRRSVGACRQDAVGPWLHGRAQPGRVQ